MFFLYFYQNTVKRRFYECRLLIFITIYHNLFLSDSLTFSNRFFYTLGMDMLYPV